MIKTLMDAKSQRRTELQAVSLKLQAKDEQKARRREDFIEKFSVTLWLKNFLFASIALVFAACSGLGGEPAIVSSLVPPTPTEIVHRYPVVAPDVELGAIIYAQHCIRCHGERGAGDGELVASGQVQDVPSFIDPETSFEQLPANWYQTITDGRIDRLMPPFKDALTDEERWAVALYTYSLHYTPEQIARGFELFQSSCVDCHGETGVGDGPRAEEFGQAPGDLSDFGGMVYIDDGAIAVSVREGIGDVMPAHGIDFGGDWTEDDIRAAVAYTRTLSLAKTHAIGLTASEIPLVAQESTPAPTTPPASDAAVETTQALPADSPDATAEATAEIVIPDFIRVTGTIINGTASGSVPASLDLTLFVLDATSIQGQYDTTSAANGSYSFENVAFIPNSTYVVTLNYRDRVYSSDFASGESLTAEVAAGVLNLPVTIYELTDDPSVISISGMVMQVTVVGDGLEIAQVFTVSNSSDRAFTSAELTADGRPISLVVTLPPGALVASLMGGDNRYVISDDGSTLFDTAMVMPGEDHIVNLVYLVQYGGGAIIEQELNYPINGAVRLLVRPSDVSVTSAQLPPLGEQVIGNSTYAAYGTDLALNVGDVLRYELGGEGAVIGEIDRGLGTTVSSNNLPLIVGILLLIVGLIGGTVYVLSLRNQAAKSAGDGRQAQIDVLASSIAQLDLDYAAGKVKEADYQVQRAALKARMATLMGKQ